MVVYNYMMDRLSLRECNSNFDDGRAIRFGQLIQEFDKMYDKQHCFPSFAHDLSQSELSKLYDKVKNATSRASDEEYDYAVADFLKKCQELIDDNGCKQCERCSSILPESEMMFNKHRNSWICNKCLEDVGF